MVKIANQNFREVITKMYDIFSDDLEVINYEDRSANKGVGVHLTFVNNIMVLGTYINYNGDLLSPINSMSKGHIKLTSTKKEYIETCNKIIKYFVSLKDSSVEAYSIEVGHPFDKFEYEYNLYFSNMNPDKERKDSRRQFTFFTIHLGADKETVNIIADNAKKIFDSKETIRSPRLRSREFDNNLRLKMMNLPKEELVKLFDLFETKELVEILLKRVGSNDLNNTLEVNKLLIKK